MNEEARLCLRIIRGVFIGSAVGVVCGVIWCVFYLSAILLLLRVFA